MGRRLAAFSTELARGFVMPDALDEDLAQGLKQARKKPRNFVILGKGTTVLKLLIDKKPIKSSDVQEAKKATKATTVVSGVVVGDGTDLVFKVVGEEPSFKTAAFKEYLSEQSGLKVKPRFQVVPELAEINDTGEDEQGENDSSESTKQPPVDTSAPPSGSIESESTESQSSESAPGGDDPLAALIAMMKSLASHVQTAILRAPSRKDELLGLVAEFQKQVKAQDAAAAKAALGAVGQALKQGAAPGSQPAPTAKLGPDFWPEWEKAKSAWRDAIDTVNGQLDKLRGELVKVDDAELKRIAEFGLNAITADHKVPLQAAIVDLDATRGGDSSKAIVAAKELVEEFRDHIDTDERVEACDDNPFEVKVTIRDSLDKALGQMEHVLGKALAG
jgi:hypothetical protein